MTRIPDSNTGAGTASPRRRRAALALGLGLSLASVAALAEQAQPGSSTMPACRTSTVTLSIPGAAFTCNTWCRIAPGDKRALATFTYDVTGGPNSATACMQRCAGTPGCSAVSWNIVYFPKARPDGARGSLTCEVWGDAVKRVDHSPAAGRRFETSYACLRNSPNDPVIRFETDRFNQDQFRPGAPPPPPPPRRNND